MKNFQGDKKTLKDFLAKTFNKLIVLDLGGWEPDYKVLVIDDEVARSRYYEKGDGISKVSIGDYYKCDIGEVNPVRSDVLLSDIISQAKKS